MEGLNTVANSPNQRYQQLIGNVNYIATGKMDLHAKIGYQATEYASGGQPPFAKLIFKLDDVYTPFAGMNVVVSGYRNVNNSASLQAQDFIATGTSLGAQYSFLEHWKVGLMGGFENDQYVANSVNVTAGRDDTYYYYKPNITYNFLNSALSLTVFYEYRVNLSTQEQTYGWNDTQLGIGLLGKF